MSMLYEDEDAYSIAAKRAMARIAALDPPVTAAEKGVDFDEAAGCFTFALLGRTIRVTYPDGITTARSGRSLSGAELVVSLHYLVYRGEPLRADGWLAYRDMPDGRTFAGWFEQAVERRLAGFFAGDPARIEDPAGSLGGVPAIVGDRSFEFPALPRVPLLLIVWSDGEEMPGSCRVLFKPTAPTYLHTEDLAVLGVLLAERLIK